MTLSTLCYLEACGHYLMLHRISKKDDVNKGKWIGTGGKFEPGEAPEECVRREVLEETGFTVNSLRYRGVITFIYDHKDPEYIFTYTSDDFELAGTGAGRDENASSGTAGLPVIPVCDEGVFDWVPKEKIMELELWEGDRVMLQYLLDDRREPFSLKLSYDAGDALTGIEELLAV